MLAYLRATGPVAGELLEREVGLTRYLEMTDSALKIAPEVEFPKYRQAIKDLRTEVGAQAQAGIQNLINLGIPRLKQRPWRSKVYVDLSFINAEYPALATKTSC